jgi:V/A-type H+-transporting ATPase subunit C
MKKKYKPDDYIYACARISAVEGGLIGSERCARLSDTKTAAEFFRALEEYGVHTQVKETASESTALAQLESALTGLLTDAFSLVSRIAPQPKLFDFFRYPYDCHNIKSALKSSLRGTEPDMLLLPFGTVEPSAAATLASQREEKVAAGLLPQHMSAALHEAAEFYAKTGDPQLIDVTLDAACYKDMTELAESYGCEYFVQLVRTKTDVTNFLTAVRLLRMSGAHINLGYFERMSLPYAKLGLDFFAPAFDFESGSASEREAALLARLRHTPYSALYDKITAAQGRPSLTYVEKQCDDFYLDTSKSARGVLYGPEPLGAYIIAREYEVRNLRIIAAGKLAGLKAETIKERLRSSYV